MKNKLFLFLAQYKSFWKMKASILDKIFAVKVKAFNSQKYFEEKKKDYSYFQSILKISQSSIFLAILLGIVLQLTNKALAPFIEKIMFYFFKYIPIELTIINEGDYVTFLATVAAIGGVFIGLHYAGLSTLNGSLYSSLPNNVRNLLIQERYGSIYIKYLSFLTYLSLVLIAFRLFGFERIYLMPFFISIGIGIGIYAFVDLGKRVFYLFDPTVLAPTLFDNLKDNVKNVQVGSLYVHNKNFQKHNNKLAKYQLDTLLTLLQLAKKESNLSAHSLIELSQDTLTFLSTYQNMKQKIPSNSLWYEEKYNHTDWYKMSETVVDISYKTATVPTPEVIYNKYWIENKTLPFILEAIKVNIEYKRFDITHVLLDSFSKYIQWMVISSEIKYAQKQLQSLQNLIIDLVLNEKLQDYQLEMIGVLEVVMNIPVVMALVFYQSIHEYSYSEVSLKLKKIDWLDKSDKYNHGFSFFTLSQLEWLSEKLIYEYRIENYIVTPHWYQLDIIMLNITERFIENITCFVETINDSYNHSMKRLNDPKFAYFKATMLNKQWEYLFKFAHQLSKIETILNDYATNRKIADLNWKKVDFAILQSKLEQFQNNLLKEISRSSILVGLLSRPTDYPDFFGQFLHITGESLIDALYEDNLDLFTEIFPSYFYGSIMKFEQLKPSQDTADWKREHEFKIAAAPIMDLIDMSGYTKVFSEFYQNDDYWKVVEQTWEKYLTDQNLTIKPEFFAAVIGLVESGFGLGHRSTNRTRWKQIVDYKLKDLEKKDIYHPSRSPMSFISSEVFVNHPSALVRLFAKEKHGSHYDGIDIFIEFYLKTLKIPEDYNYGRRDYRDIVHSLEHEEEFYINVLKEKQHEN